MLVLIKSIGENLYSYAFVLHGLFVVLIKQMTIIVC